jgi:hypothetical protein
MNQDACFKPFSISLSVLKSPKRSEERIKFMSYVTDNNLDRPPRRFFRATTNTKHPPLPSPRQPTSQVFTGSSSLSPPTIKILIRILSSSASTVPAGGKVVEHLFTLGWSQTKLASTMPDHMFPDHTFSNGAA